MVKFKIFTTKIVIGFVFLVLLVSKESHTQFMQGPRIISPEIHPDNTVTFRIRAPLATEVRISGE
ncbi:hypothetical protein JW824_03205, partial [bacterium]